MQTMTQMTLDHHKSVKWERERGTQETISDDC